MNDDQNEPENGSQTNDTSDKASLATGGINDINNPGDQVNDEYYAVDYAKRDVVSTIGDGEMHDEGLAIAPDTLTDLISSTDRLADEQDQAESRFRTIATTALAYCITGSAF